MAIIGPGRIGQALGRLLASAGVRIERVAARRLGAARSAARFIGRGRPVRLDSRELARARVLVLATSDSALPEVARVLAAGRTEWKSCVVLHTSGAWPAGGERSVLQPFRRRGAAAGSLHPLQTVTSRRAGVRNLTGCFWAIEGDPRAVRLAREWVRVLRGSAFTLAADRKPAYHAAAVIACAGVVALMEESRRLLELSGVPARQARRMLEGFVAETASNFARLGARRALTGPVARGDWATIRRHRAALGQQAPELLPLYRELLRSMVKIAGSGARRKKPD